MASIDVVRFAVLCGQFLLVVATSFDVQLVYQDQPDCQGGAPSVEISTRWAPANTGSPLRPSQPFSEWKLSRFYTGNCSTSQTLLHSIDINTVYQFRVQLSPAHSCHCVNIETVGSISLINNWCIQDQPVKNIGNQFCATESNSTYFSQPVTIEDNFIHDVRCSHPFVMQNNIDTAVAYEGMFCCCPESKCLFPLKPLKIMNSANKTQITISYSLIMSYPTSQNRNNCSSLSNINEGILLSASSSGNFEDGIHFYYSKKKTGGSNQNLQVNSSVTNDFRQLSYNDRQTFMVPSTFDSQTGKLNITVNTAYFDRVVSLTWGQRSSNEGPNCDVWSLDNVEVNITLPYEISTRTVLSEDFENMMYNHWTLVNMLITNKSSNCIGSDHCVYATGGPGDVLRTATTHPLDLRILTAVTPPLTPTNQSFNCSNNSKILKIRFKLLMSRFQYPTPSSNQSHLNGVMMNIPGDTPLAYYVPLANTNWPGFNTSNMSLNIDGVEIPVFSPHPNQLIESSVCVDNITDSEVLEIVWRQDNFTHEHDYWYLSIESVHVGNTSTSITNISESGNSWHTLSLSNSNNSVESFVVQCVPASTDMIKLIGNDLSSPRSVILTINLTALNNFHSLINATKISGAQDSLENLVTELNNMLENPVHNIQRLSLLTRAHAVVQLKGIVNRDFLETYIKVARDAIYDLENNINVTDVLSLLTFLDDIALLLRMNATINATSIVLVVQEVVSGDDGPVLGITVDDSNITLPAEVFTNKNGSAIVVSYYFQNISHLLAMPNQSISSILSSTLSCDGCRTSNLSENVTIHFSLPASKDEEDGTQQCAFVNTRQPMHMMENGSFWSTNGCHRKVLENGSVLCLCNHLTHFAILLSPGVPQNDDPVHNQVLTIIGQVFVSLSLVFLLATIIIFVINKSLWNMRNYIHIMLCANLFAAQLVFVVGVERTENKTVCSAIAVLLHYMWLVVFMWMLMEGVVLYVALVRVFITHTGRYIAGFTITSYGLPLVYMVVVVPIGFLVNTDDIGNHYGQYNESSGELLACWLRYHTNFIWAFIVPVIIIIMTNFVFLLMTLKVLYHHYKKQRKKSILKSTWHWVKVIAVLVVVMGIAWIANLLFFNVNLLFVAYIMTIFIAGQGIIIFILFVPLSKQVRDAYLKWWKIAVSQSTLLSSNNFTVRHKSSHKVKTVSVVRGSTNGVKNCEVYQNYELENSSPGHQERTLPQPSSVKYNDADIKIIHLTYSDT